MKKINIVGVSGNGKTTLAKKLSSELRVPHIQLDALYHQFGWTPTNIDVFRKNVADKINDTDGWVIDGSYHSKLGDLVLKNADTIVWLDLPLAVSMYRLLKRCMRDIITQRELYNGNRQTLKEAFFVKDSLFSYAIKVYFKRRKNWPVYFAQFQNLKVIRLRSRAEVQQWLKISRSSDYQSVI